MSRALLAGMVAAVASCALVSAAAAQQPPRPGTSTDPARCQWEWKAGGGIGVWAERCQLNTGVWELAFRPELPGFVLTIDGKEETVVLQVFDKPASAPISAILPALRAGGHIPDDDDCVFAPAAPHSAPRTLAFFEIVPAGARKARFEATPKDEVPEPPCGDYGWSTHGVRYFLTDIRHPGTVVYVNAGQDGLMFDDRTVTITRP